MGQKTNPISLRLKTTNKTFASSWYSDLYYPNLITQELKTREYLSKLFAQIRYPNPCLSVSFLPKRTKTLVIYLNPFQSRRRGCERFQLRLIPEAGSFDSSIILTRKSDNMTASTSLSGGGLMTTPSIAGGLLATGAQPLDGRGWPTNPMLSKGHRGGRQGAPDSYNTSCNHFLGEKDKKLFIQKLLLLTVLYNVTRKDLISKKNYQFFQKLHHMAWFQGREENQSLLSRKELGLAVPPRWPGVRWPPLAVEGVANEPLAVEGATIKLHALPPTSSLIGSNCKAASSSAGLLFAERWSKCNEKEIGAGPQLRKRESSTRLERLKLKKNESSPFLSYQLTNRKKDQIHLTNLESIISRGLTSPTTLHLYKSVDEAQAANFMSDEIAYYLERRVPFRRIKQLLLRELKTCYIEGVRVICSGRVGGRSKKAQRARGEGLQWGHTSSHVFSSKLSFSSRSALTPFGKVGIKVWICYK